MAEQVYLSSLRLSVWDQKRQQQEPVLDGKHDEVAAFLDTKSTLLGEYLEEFNISLNPKAKAEDLPHLEVSAILSDLTYAYEAIPAMDWLSWYEHTVKPQLAAHNQDDDILVNYPAKGTRIRD